MKSYIIEISLTGVVYCILYMDERLFLFCNSWDSGGKNNAKDKISGIYLRSSYDLLHGTCHGVLQHRASYGPDVQRRISHCFWRNADYVSGLLCHGILLYWPAGPESRLSDGDSRDRSSGSCDSGQSLCYGGFYVPDYEFLGHFNFQTSGNGISGRLAADHRM